MEAGRGAHLRSGILDCLLGDRCYQGPVVLVLACVNVTGGCIVYLCVDVDDNIVASIGHFEREVRPAGSSRPGFKSDGRCG